MGYSYNSVPSCFVVQIALPLTIGSSFRLVPVPFWHGFIFFWALPCFLAPQDTPDLCCIFFCHSPGINHFSKEPWFHCWRMVFRSQDLGTGCVHCYESVIASRSSQRTQLEKSMYANSCTHIYLYLFLSYLPVFIFENHEFVVVFICFNLTV